MKKSLLLLLLILFLIWLYRRDKRTSVLQPTKETSTISDTQLVIYSGISTTASTFYEEKNLINVTDQTFSHSAGRYVNTIVVVNNQVINALISYPTVNSVRIQSNIPITGKLILS